MIHSLAGGNLQNSQICDIVKVKILENNSIIFCLSKIQNVNVGDIVYVPFGKLDILTKAEILRIDKNVDSKSFPIKF